MRRFLDIYCEEMMPDAPLYAPLNPDRHEIRLLRILPSPDKNNTIYLTLEVATLDSKLLYRALSYEWGPPDIGSPSTRVYLNSYDVPTTPNLRLALAHLEKGPYYWIDALCINQSDNSERGHQVRQMTRIYQQAYGIDVWLGIEEANSRLGIDLINQAESAWSETRIMSKGSMVQAGWVEARLADRAYAAHWEGLRQVFQRSYWKRLWIIQELVVTLNPDAVLLHCGSTRASFRSLRMLVKQIRTHGHSLPYINEKGSNHALGRTIHNSARFVHAISKHVRSWKKHNQSDRHMGLLHLLSEYHEQLCSDPRDRIYALLGTSKLYSDLEIPIDYSISPLDVYQNAAKYIIAGSKRLDVLLYAGSHWPRISTWPSWLPNWEEYNFGNRTIRHHRRGWNSSGRLSAIARFSHDNTTLTTNIFIVGTIKAILETGNVISHRRSMSLYLASGKAILVQRLHFINWSLESLEPIPQPPVLDSTMNLSRSAVRAFYESLLYTSHGTRLVESSWPLEDFLTLCDGLYHSEVDQRATEDSKKLRELIHPLKYQTRQCSITIADSQNSVYTDADTDPGQPNGILQRTTIGLCSPKSELGDVVVVARGCRYPVLLRQVGDKYQLIGEMYVYGFMEGEAVARFPEVEIDLI